MKYLIVIEQTATGYSAYRPTFRVALRPAVRARTSRER